MRDCVALRWGIAATIYLALPLIPFAGPHVVADELIWTVMGTSPQRGVQRLDLESLQLRYVFVNSSEFAASLAVDEVGGYMYWSTIGNIVVKRAKLDRSRVVETILSGPSTTGTLSDIAIDSVNRKLYWTSVNADAQVRRSDLDGEHLEVVSLATDNPVGISVDSKDGKLYWADSGTRAIVQSNLDGSNQRNLTSVVRSPQETAFDPTTRDLYWSEHRFETVRGFWTLFPGEGKIMKINVDTLAISTVVTGLDSPVALTIDVPGKKLYWGDANTDLIQRSTTTGQNIETVFNFVNEVPNPSVGITDLYFLRSTPIPEPTSAGMLILLIAWLGLCRPPHRYICRHLRLRSIRRSVGLGARATDATRTDYAEALQVD